MEEDKKKMKRATGGDRGEGRGKGEVSSFTERGKKDNTFVLNVMLSI